jgi:hypothetical protein
MRDSFVFYRSFYEAIRELPRDIQGEVYTCIMEYALYGITTENLKPIARSIFMLVKPQIDINYQRFLNGNKGGRPNQSETKPEPNVNVNVNENVSIPDGICRDAPDAVSDSFKKFVGDFNEIRKSKFQAIEKARRQFNARLKEGFTPDQMLEALKAAMKDDFHVKNGYKYLTPEFFTRPDKLERFLNSNAGNGERISIDDFLKKLNGE